MDSFTSLHHVPLLPLPLKFQARPGVCLLGPESALRVDVADVRVIRSLVAWRAGLRPHTPGGGRSAPISVSINRSVCPEPDGYQLTVTLDIARLLGGSPSGCYYGVQTLRQLLVKQRDGVRCCTIVDRPDFATRGLLHDVTRGKVPRLETLKLIADRLAALKANQLQLNIEHAFAFSFDQEICPSDEGLTPEEVRELDRYCHDRFIDLVPAVATLGHMGRILSMPRYRHLAEIEASRSWEQMGWPERMRGLTLDCLNPESHRLVERMWGDVLDAFSSPVVNVCGDEPWDLGAGRSRERVAVLGKGEVYVDHLRRTHEICAARGRRTQFWSDVARNYPRLLGRLPEDMTVLHWGYDDRADYAGTAAFTGAGLATCVCPGTSGWKRVINAMDLAERNISTFSAAGKRHGAVGLINTDWGDHGHFNLLACSWHGIALGAACAWNAAHPTGEQFDEAFCRHVLGVPNAGLIGLLREASAIAERGETWRWLWMPMAALEADQTIPMPEALDRSAAAATEVGRLCRSLIGSTADSTDFEELAVACLFTELVVEKLRFRRDWSNVRRTPGGNGRTRRDWAARVREASARYQAVWNARNKPSGLADIKAALDACIADVCAGACS